MTSRLGSVEGRGQPSCAQHNLCRLGVTGVSVCDMAGHRIPLRFSCCRVWLKIAPPRLLRKITKSLLEYHSTHQFEAPSWPGSGVVDLGKSLTQLDSSHLFIFLSYSSHSSRTFSAIVPLPSPSLASLIFTSVFSASVPIRIQTCYTNIFNLKEKNLPWPPHTSSAPLQLLCLLWQRNLLITCCFHFLTSDFPMSPFQSRLHSYHLPERAPAKVVYC